MPRIVRKDALVWHFLRYGSEAQVRDLFQRSEVSPYDVDEGRQSLAYVSIEMHVQTSILILGQNSRGGSESTGRLGSCFPHRGR